jgi:hypothetical protein
LFAGEGSNPLISTPNESQTSCTSHHQHIQLLLLKLLTGPRGFLRVIASYSLWKDDRRPGSFSHTHCLVQTCRNGKYISPDSEASSTLRLGKGSLHVANEKVFPSFFARRNDRWKISPKILGVCIYNTVHLPRSSVPSVRIASACLVPPKSPLSVSWSKAQIGYSTEKVVSMTLKSTHASARPRQSKAFPAPLFSSLQLLGHNRRHNQHHEAHKPNHRVLEA